MLLTGNTILITGATSGIGLQLAREFSRRGNRVLIAARNASKLEKALAQEPTLESVQLDVTDRQAIFDVAAELRQRYPELNVLINNAGIMTAEDLSAAQPDPSIAEATIETNLLGPLRLTAALLPQLRHQPRSSIINVTSGLAFVPLVRTPTYCATKAALHSYTLSLRRQLEGTTTEVIELVPPAVRTDLMPGHATDPNAMPLDEFIAEVMTLLDQQPTPAEVCVRRVEVLRNAALNNRFNTVFDQLNPPAA